jgi:hypothetical protein
VRFQPSRLRYTNVRFTAEILYDTGLDRTRYEEDLDRAGVPIPLPHRSEWATALTPGHSWFLAVRDDGGACCCGFAVQVGYSRAVPGHHVLTVDRLGPALSDEARQAGLEALRHLARRRRNVLRVRLRTFSRDANIRRAIADAVTELGFRKADSGGLYTQTVVLDVRPDESEVFSSLHATCRRHIRAPAKKGFTVGPVLDPAYADRMDSLMKETMARTKGPYTPHDWASTIELSHRHPSFSRLVGTFEPDAAGPESLVAFAWGCNHGDHATYTAAASTRVVSHNFALGYAPAWELIRWAQQTGAHWFDFGGITEGSYGSGDRLGGISDFKRYFSGQVVTVGAEWVLEPNPVRARLGRAISHVAARVRRASSTG